MKQTARAHKQIMLALQIGSTTLVPSDMRGKLSGLYNTVESLGRFLGPVGYAVVYAWSVSPSTAEAYKGWVGHGFVFYVSAAALSLVAMLAWRTLTVENLIGRKMEEEGVDVGGGGGSGDGSSKRAAASSSSSLRSYSELEQQNGGGEEETHGNGRRSSGYRGGDCKSTVDLVV